MTGKKTHIPKVRAFRVIRVILLVLFCVAPARALAMPEYSQSTGQGCKTCHKSAMGGELGEKGLEYAASGYVWPPEGGYRALGPIRKSVRTVIGAFHIIGAFIWFGTILYVHIVLRPGYASKGLPKGEKALGLAMMGVVGVTGLLLTVSKVRGVEVLFNSPWGRILLLKIILYFTMVSSALFVVAFVGPRLRSVAGRPLWPRGGVFDPATLSGFDGKEGRPACIGYRGKVYDVTSLRLWKEGVHMGRHGAGADLTDFIAMAPHGDEVLEGLVPAGSFNESLKPPQRPAQKAFYVVAYMNLTLVFVVLSLIAVWRWGI